MRERPEEESPILPSCGDGMFEYTYNEDSKNGKSTTVHEKNKGDQRP